MRQIAPRVMRTCGDVCKVPSRPHRANAHFNRSGRRQKQHAANASTSSLSGPTAGLRSPQVTLRRLAHQARPAQARGRRRPAAALPGKTPGVPSCQFISAETAICTGRCTAREGRERRPLFVQNTLAGWLPLLAVSRTNTTPPIATIPKRQSRYILCDTCTVSGPRSRNVFAALGGCTAGGVHDRRAAGDEHAALFRRKLRADVRRAWRADVQPLPRYRLADRLGLPRGAISATCVFLFVFGSSTTRERCAGFARPSASTRSVHRLLTRTPGSQAAAAATAAEPMAGADAVGARRLGGVGAAPGDLT